VYYPFGIPYGSESPLFIYNVKTFGAKGDGVTDDTAAIRAAVLAAVGGVCYFPPGTYVVDGLADAPATAPRGIPIPQNSYLYAFPGTVTITQGPMANVSGLFCTNNYFPVVGSGGSEFTNVTIDGFVFDQNASAQTYGATQEQYAVVMLGSLQTCKNNRFLNCSTAAVGQNQIGTGLLVGSAVEQPAHGSRCRVNFNRFEVCTGVAMWMTNLKGDTYGPLDPGVPAPGSYGVVGGSDFSFNEFYNCVHGLYIEDRCCGWIAEGISYRSQYSNLSNNGVGVTVVGSSSGKLGAVVAGAGVGVALTGFPQTPTQNIILDLVVDTTHNGGVQLSGNVAVIGTVTSAVSAGALQVPVTITQGSIPGAGNAGACWMSIVDGANSEYVQVAYYSAGVAYLDTAIQHNHTGGQTIGVDTGLNNISGTVVVRNAGTSSGSPPGGLVFSAAWDCSLLVRSYDSRQIPFAPGVYPTNPAPTEFYGIEFTNASQRCVTYGTVFGTRDFGIYDDGTNTECLHMGIAGQIGPAGVHQRVYATQITSDPNLPSKYYGTGAPSSTAGKNGDEYFRADGGSMTTIYQMRAGAWVGIV
jgi:hypothetical protein